MSNLALIVGIVRKGWGSTVLEASVNAGARGGTVLFGRGAGIHEHEKIFGMSIEPEKEILLTIVNVIHVDAILDAAFEEQRQFIKNGTVGNVRGILHGAIG